MANAGRVAIVPKGDYSSSTAYKRLDLVRYNEKAYVAKKANTGVAPTNTEYWMLMTSDGITIDTALSDTSTNPVQNKVVKTKIDNIQTTSRATLSTAGWYRVAEFKHTTSLFQFNIALIKGFGRYQPETHDIDVVANATYGKANISSVDTCGNTQTLTKFRIAKDSSKWYADVYFDRAGDELFYVTVTARANELGAWKAITPTITSETVDGVTVTTTYDIPANASPVTSVDLANYFPKSGGQIDGGDNAIPLTVSRTNGDYTELGFKGTSGFLGYLGFSSVDNPVFENSSRNAVYPLLHTGNSAKVAIQESAPTDTSALWVDTANNKVKAYVDGAWEVVSEDRSANAASHNTIHGGRDITSLFDNGTFSTQVANGTFTNIYPGDYITKTITYNDTSYTITGIVADLDYHYAYASGYSTIGEHHVAMVFTGLSTAPMNETNTTEGGYAGSLMHTTTLPAMLEAIKEAFGEEHIITHKKLLTNAVGTSLYNKFGAATGASSDWTWQDSAISLMSEAQVYGTTVFSSSGYDTGEANRQLSIFKLKNFNEVLGWRWLWLRDVASSSYFCSADSGGHATYGGASGARAVCPLILLK